MGGTDKCSGWMGSFAQIYLKKLGPLLNDPSSKILDIQNQREKTLGFQMILFFQFFWLGSIYLLFVCKQNPTTTEYSVWFEIPTR